MPEDDQEQRALFAEQRRYMNQAFFNWLAPQGCEQCFFLVIFCTVVTMWAKFPLWNVQSVLLEKMSKICHIWGKKVRNCHIEKMNLWRSPKQSRILKYFYFAVWPVAKFGSSLFWMIASPSTWQKWKKKKKKTLCLWTMTSEVCMYQL
jgi:hypothetical protein